MAADEASNIVIANVIEEGKLGGPQVRMIRVAKSLYGQANTLIVMPDANSNAFRELCDFHGVPYRILSLTGITKEWRAALRYVVFSPVEILRLAWLFWREDVDLVHISGGSWQLKGVIAARLVGVPSVWHLNDTSMPGVLRALFCVMQRMASGFIYSGFRVVDYYGHHVTVGRPFAVIPPPVDINDYDPEVKVSGDEQAIREFGDSFVIGTVGNVNPVKGFETLIRAGAVLSSHGYDIKVVIVGQIFARQQGYARRLEILAREVGLDSISFVGRRSDIRPLLERFDAYVCSSVSESWGMALWEAMAMAKPVVSTDVGDVGRHVVDGESGYVVPVGDPAVMADRIGRLLDEPENRLRMGRMARKAAAAFSPESIAAKTLDIYKQVVARQSSDGPS